MFREWFFNEFMTKRSKQIGNRAWVWAWAGGALLYWWFVAKLQGQQLVAAAVTGFVVAAVLAKVAASARLSFELEWRWLGLLLRRLPGQVVRDFVLLMGALWRTPGAGSAATGAYQSRKFDPGGADAKSAARRALVFVAISLPPNTFAVSIQGKDSLLVHQLVFRPEPANEEWPI